jgi:PBSX family phage portal protein
MVAEGNTKGGRLAKVLFLNESGEPVGSSSGSKQLLEDPFQGSYDERGLVEPPFSLEQLLFMSEMHPVHNAAIEQKAADIAGTGWEWRAKPELKGKASEEQRSELEERFRLLAGDEATMVELLGTMWLDYETGGQGYFEVAKDVNGVVQQLYNVPAHTIRWHRDGKRLAQRRAGKAVWFRRWGLGDDDITVTAQTGYAYNPGQTRGDPANDMLVFRRPSRRSSWYGIPTWIASIGWITLALAARDYNLLYFANRREARWVIVLTNMEDDPNFEQDLREAMSTDLKSPHRNLVLPIIGDGKVDFHKMSTDQDDAAFQKLMVMCDDAVLVGHRMPAERVGIARTGPLGGSTAAVTNRVYQEGVLQPGQELLASRINRFIERELVQKHPTTGKPVKAEMEWEWIPRDVDMTEEEADLKWAVEAFKHDILTLDEAREKLGLEPADTLEGNMRYSELTGRAGGGLPGSAAPQNFDQAEKALLDRIGALDEAVSIILSGPEF